MSMSLPQRNLQLIWTIVVLSLVIVFGISLRFIRILDQDFIFYDEGYYLNWSRPLAEAMSRHSLQRSEDFSSAIQFFVSRCLGSGKTLWFMLVDSRYFWGDFKDWAFGRVLSAVLGVGTLMLTFRFTQKYFNDLRLAGIATALLAILPSHVFYSRIGMQESLSTILVLAGFYFYTFPLKLNGRTFLSGLFFGAAFFSNYRLLMLPVLITFWEVALSFQHRQWPQFRKWLWTMIVFWGCVFGIGSFNHGENTQVIFSWVFHQADMAKEQADWLNVLSYPYYFFRLESFLFGAAFFGSLFFLKKMGRPVMMVFGVVMVQMLVFSCASEKGARYICVVLPFAVMVVAYFIQYLLVHGRDPLLKVGVGLLSVAMVLMMAQKSLAITLSHSDYRASAKLLQEKIPGVKYLSTQNYIQNLFSANARDVVSPPGNVMDLIRYYELGYRYLVLCPQAYISMTADQKRFTLPLKGYLNLLSTEVKPVKTFSHFSPALLERFVCDHNENLLRSIRFLNMADEYHLGTLRIYQLSTVLPQLISLVQPQASKL